MFYGEMPESVDHIDCNCLNNRIENLRKASRIENAYNARLSKSNTSGYKGVSWCSKNKKWAAECMVNKRKHRIGYFDDKEKAAFAVKSFREQNHGKFARHS
jgi:hypothetical protein